MSYYDRQHTAAERLKKIYTPGTRVRLISMDDYGAPPPGTLGTVVLVDDMATIHVKWDDGSCLGVVYDMDSAEIVK